jgi:hypothetical protein
MIVHSGVSISASGNNTVASAVANTKYEVINYVLVANGTVSVKFTDGATDISGPMPLVVNSGASATGTRDAPLMTTTTGNTLSINLSDTVAVYGHITYNRVSTNKDP